MQWKMHELLLARSEAFDQFTHLALRHLKPHVLEGRDCVLPALYALFHAG